MAEKSVKVRTFPTKSGKMPMTDLERGIRCSPYPEYSALILGIFGMGIGPGGNESAYRRVVLSAIPCLKDVGSVFIEGLWLQFVFLGWEGCRVSQLMCGFFFRYGLACLARNVPGEACASLLRASQR
jgi:hypothetical protein